MQLKIKSVVHVHHSCTKFKGRNNTASMEIVHKVCGGMGGAEYILTMQSMYANG